MKRFGLIDISLECSIGKSYGFENLCSGSVSGGIRLQNAVQMHSARLDALSRSIRIGKMDSAVHSLFKSSFFGSRGCGIILISSSKLLRRRLISLLYFIALSV
jgi:hypothetical protein